MITTQLSELPPITQADRRRILATPRTAGALLGEMPALNAVQLGGTASATALPVQFMVATWNVERFLFPEDTATHLAPVTPDIVRLSEVDHGMARQRDPVARFV